MNRLIAEALGAGAVILFCWWGYQHIVGVGEKKIEAKDAEIAEAQTIHNLEVESRAKLLAAEQIGTLKAQLAAPPAIDAPHLRLCNNQRGSGPVRQDAGPGPTPNASQEQSSLVQEPREAGDDPGPDIDKHFADDDSLILALQKRIADEVGICR